ncbi:CDP-alcohol phosphatidyltransferase family protein [Roseomonas sp. JC162]|uniref:CDP-diacylglycerol--glycerol-3-phosphate 3-phosphatidyltransferase n=1 Tax=Neoroseomonas marina TaxID=1232220 RepID=A0A848E7I5_9PROT|nr:CDP-alcohol phosphatidyltransferase family protein [Neoroseomonas marina]NMJ40384.1 CDP-alcohol phosphatidyltransferase family protein [Neoroseomonas marina]
MPDAPDQRPRRTALPASGDAEAGLFTLPNLITLGRLFAVPAAVWLMLQHRHDAAFLVFVGAGISDAIDGWLARVRNARSALGALLDPIADKALLVSVYVTLAAMNVLPDWLAILVVFRDLLIVGGVILLWVLGVPARIKPLLISKANTAAQIALAALALFLSGWQVSAPFLLEAMILLVAVTTFASGAAYVMQAARLTATGAK